MLVQEFSRASVPYREVMLKLRLAKLGFAVAFPPIYLRCGTKWPFGVPLAFGGSFDHPFASTAIAELLEETGSEYKYTASTNF